MPTKAGVIGLIGSGETAANGGRAFEAIARRHPSPLRVAILETPAGFELNSEQVAGRVAEFIARRLCNYAPHIHIIPARRRGGPLGADNPEILAPLAEADLIFMGPGSPTYAVRQLRGSLAWQAVMARHGQGASLIFASAAAIAVGCAVLPVYEIFKAGEDPAWREGLDLLGRFGARLAIIPHWNNTEGGAGLDTSRCFMGRARFEALASMLPADTGVLGIDEYTALIIDPVAGSCEVLGQGGVTVIRDGIERRYAGAELFPAAALGLSQDAGEAPPMPAVLAGYVSLEDAGPPPDVLALVDTREQARAARDWVRADALRERLSQAGWDVRDSPDGPQIIRR